MRLIVHMSGIRHNANIIVEWSKHSCFNKRGCHVNKLHYYSSNKHNNLSIHQLWTYRGRSILVTSLQWFLNCVSYLAKSWISNEVNSHKGIRAKWYMTLCMVGRDREIWYYFRTVFRNVILVCSLHAAVSDSAARRKQAYTPSPTSQTWQSQPQREQQGKLTRPI